MAIVVETRNN